MRRILLLLVALSLAGGTAWYFKRTLDRAQQAASAATQREPVRFKEVLVAASPVQLGEFVRPEAFRWQAWPDVDVPSTFFVKGQRDPGELEGAVARRPLGTGEPVTDAALVKPGERGFLAAVLTPGMRAISVPVDDASSNAGLIYPGDHVDLLLSQAIPQANGGTARRVAETILEDVRVLAMGRRIQPHEETDMSAGSSQIRTVTLEVSAEGAEAVALVTDLGRLSISLRSLAVTAEDVGRGPSPEARRLTWDSDVAKALAADADQLTIFRGKDAIPVDLRAGALP